MTQHGTVKTGLLGNLQCKYNKKSILKTKLCFIVISIIIIYLLDRLCFNISSKYLSYYIVSNKTHETHF